MAQIGRWSVALQCNCHYVPFIGKKQTIKLNVFLWLRMLQQSKLFVFVIRMYLWSGHFRQAAYSNVRRLHTIHLLMCVLESRCVTRLHFSVIGHMPSAVNGTIIIEHFSFFLFRAWIVQTYQSSSGAILWSRAGAPPRWTRNFTIGIAFIHTAQ